MAEPLVWLPLNGTLENLGLDSVSSTNNGPTWGSKLSNCTVTASNSTYTEHTIDIL